MKVGDKIVTIEEIVVVDGLGHDLLTTGTEGTIARKNGKLLSLQTAKGLYDGIPRGSVKLKRDGKAA